MLIRGLKILLFPIAIIYQLVTDLRNFLYDRGWLTSKKFKVHTVVIGNLTVGGTGKTPMTEFVLKKLLGSGSNVAMLSRGYGRKTKGFLQADSSSTPATIGDEPFQVYNKFVAQVPIFVGEKRVEAIENILSKAEFHTIVLDDAYQHRQLNASRYVLLTDYNKLFYEDWLLPTGLLRESRKGADRADVVVVTKTSPLLQNVDKDKIKSKIALYTNAPVYFSQIVYQSVRSYNNIGSFSSKKSIVAVTGLARATPFIDHLNTQFDLIKHFEFADHYEYRQSDIDMIVNYCKNRGAQIVTTEKDLVKLIVPELNWRNFGGLFYMPIEVEIENEEEFLQHICN